MPDLYTLREQGYTDRMHGRVCIATRVAGQPSVSQEEAESLREAAYFINQSVNMPENCQLVVVPAPQGDFFVAFVDSSVRSGSDTAQSKIVSTRLKLRSVLKEFPVAESPTEGQSGLIELIKNLVPEIKTNLDQPVGSGTTVMDAMNRHLPNNTTNTAASVQSL